MILVDTSVFILQQHIPFGITSVIYQEILQGAKNRKEFALLDNYPIEVF